MSERTDDATPIAHNGIEYERAVLGEHEDDATLAPDGTDDAVTPNAAPSNGDETTSSSGGGDHIEDTTPAGIANAAALDSGSGDDVASTAAPSGSGAKDVESGRTVHADSSSEAESAISEEAGSSTHVGIEDVAGASGSSETPLASGRGAGAAASARATRNKRGAGSDSEVAEFTPEPLEDDEFRSALEAMLLIVDAPAPVELLADALRDKPARVERTLHEIAAELSARASGIDLRFVGDGWRFYTRSEYAPYVERMLLDGARSKLTRAALETLAVVAYRQPVTRTRVSAVRGVNVDGVMRTLLARGLIAEAGVDPETNGTQYCTTELFLERIGLASLSDLPPLAPLLPGVDLIDEINESLETDPRYTRLKKSAETDLDLGTEED